MGAWGTDAFGNDTACDWSYDLEGQTDFTHVERTLERILALPLSQSIDANAAEEAIAAAEVVARAQGQRELSSSYTKGVDAWLESLTLKPSPALAIKASAVVDRILTGPCKLLELWAESDEEAAWRENMISLKNRILLAT